MRHVFGIANGAPDVRLQIAAGVPELARFDAALLRRLLRHLARQIGGGADRSLAGCIGEVALAQGRCDRLAITLRSAPPLRLGTGPLGADPLDQAGTAPDPRAAQGALAGQVVERLAAVLGASIRTAAEVGSTLSVVVELPIEPVPDPPVSGQRGSGDRLRALVIDDIGTNRFVVAQLLRLLDIEAQEAESGAAALECLRARAFDVVLLDMNMPTMDGEATFRAIRGSGESFARVPVIALTADALSEQRERYLALGLDGYVPKPVDKRVLWAEIAASTA
jgi:CheY-like chemotaxis protein